MIHLLVIKDSVVQMKWVPTTHVLADIFTKEMPITDLFKSFLEGSKYALHQTVKEAEGRRKIIPPAITLFLPHPQLTALLSAYDILSTLTVLQCVRYRSVCCQSDPGQD